MRHGLPETHAGKRFGGSQGAMRQVENSISRTIVWIAGVLVGFMTIAVPIGYFVISYHHISLSVESEANIAAEEISRLISTNPELWVYEDARLKALLSLRLKGKAAESRRVFLPDETVVAEIGGSLSSPLLTRSEDLKDAGATVGRIEISRSMKPLLMKTIFIATAGCLGGGIIFFALRILPLRTIRRAEKTLRESEEKYRSLVESTDDAIFLVDREYRYLFVNTAYLGRIGLAGGEILGQTYAASHQAEEAREFMEMVDKVFTSRESLQYEHFSRRSAVYYLRTLSPVKGPDGTVTAVTVVSKNISEQKHLEEELRALSLSDDLTGLYNRRGFMTLASQQLRMANRLGRKTVLFSTDLDKLKDINDEFGHKAGDNALNLTAGILRETFRETDIIGRIGGDEFVVLVVEHADYRPASLLDRLCKNVDTLNKGSGLPYRLSLSVGSAESDPEKQLSITELMDLADKTMYEQKKLKQSSAS